MNALIEPLGPWRDPADVAGLFARHKMPALLHSGGVPSLGAQDADINRWSILCADPFEIVEWSPGQRGDLFRRLEAAVARHRASAAPESPFTGGAVGFVGYEAGKAVETIRPSPDRRRPLGAAQELSRLPGMLFGLYAWAIVWDHHLRTWAVVSTGLPEKGGVRQARASVDAEAVRRVLRDEIPPAGDPSPSASCPPAMLSTSVDRERYLGMVQEARGLIAAGEFYQVNLSQRIELPAPDDPLSLFREVCRHSPAPFSAYLDAGAFQVISASPERFLRLRGRSVESRPIKGTRPRGATPAGDADLAGQLLASAKDRAENVMIVDLVRNDLGRVCLPGSVKAVEVCRLESYASVHHLVSIVRGELAPDVDRADLLYAMFPGGSMTGAPKVRAMQAIEDLEPVERGIYAGALGYLSFCGGMDLSIVIRTAVVAGGRTWLSVGGGIVADSDPAQEWQESLDKASSLLKGMAGMTATSRSAGRPRPKTTSPRSAR